MVPSAMLRTLVLVLAFVQAMGPPATLPASAAATLRQSLAAADRHQEHLWRDTPPTNDDRTVNGYVEIPAGERRKFEFNLALHRREIDRELPRSLGGYPVNYGFVPQTVSYDGDPFDILVLGPALRGGAMVRGITVGIMHMEDEKGLDSKIVVSPVDRYGRATQPIRPADQRRMTDFFNHYKDHEPGKFSRVLGWGGLGEARAFLNQTHAFFLECGTRAEGDCRVER
jgi:inorganic pyrophosphatase